MALITDATDWSELQEVMTQMLVDWDRCRGTVSLTDFVTEQLTTRGHGLVAKNAHAIAVEISDTIDAVEQGHNELRQHRREGGSRENWLERQLDKSLQVMSVTDRELFLEEMCQGVSAANQAVLLWMTGVQADPNQRLRLVRPDARSAVLALLPEVERGVKIAAVATDAVENGQDDHDSPIIPLVEAGFSTQLGSSQERELKQVLSAATVAQHSGAVKAGMQGIAPATVTLLIDRSISAAKVCYKTEMGDLSGQDAVEYLIDRGTVLVSELVKRACVVTGERVGDALGHAIGQFFGPAGLILCVRVGRIVGRWAGAKVGEALSRGVVTLAEKAKDVVRSGYEAVKSWGRAVVAAVLG